MSFGESLQRIPKHYAAEGDLIMSHVVAVLSATFPDGEDFFVRSVRHYRDQLTDPELKRQVAGFIGQESVHGREHLPGTLAQERAVPKNQAAMKQSFSRAAVSQWLALAVDWKGLVTCTQSQRMAPDSRSRIICVMWLPTLGFRVWAGSTTR